MDTEEIDNELHAPPIPQLKVGVSACLLGEEVRFDGGHKYDAFLNNTLSQFVTWVSVCPEVEMGLGVPRETLRLVKSESSPQLFAPKSGKNHTEAMKKWADKRLNEINGEDLCGYILKSKSPSCGLFRVKMYEENSNRAEKKGRGIFADALAKKWPLLPIEEDGRLNDPHLRENFIDRLFFYYKWKRFLSEDPSSRGLVAFHTSHKMTLLGRNEKQSRILGRIVARAGKTPWEELIAEYSHYMMLAMQEPTSRKRVTNVLMHLMGFLKHSLSKDDKDELLLLVQDYRTGLVPLIVPTTLMKHYFRKINVPDWIHQQSFLHPYPKELMLRNNI